MTYSPGQTIIYYSQVVLPQLHLGGTGLIITAIQKLGLLFTTATFIVKRDMTRLS